jgi:hypothetical protein
MLLVAGRFKGRAMLFVVKIRRERENLATGMSGIREWLDTQGFEPNVFRCVTDEESVIFRLEFKSESEDLPALRGHGGPPFQSAKSGVSRK